MRRKRVVIAVGLILVAVVAAGVAMRLRPEDPRLARSRLIDQEHCDRIKEGMSRAEVEAILGGPPGDFATKRMHYAVVYIDGTPLDKRWYGNEGVIEVQFDYGGKVGRALFEPGRELPPRFLPERVRAWLRRLWP